MRQARLSKIVMKKSKDMILLANRCIRKRKDKDGLLLRRLICLMIHEQGKRARVSGSPRMCLSEPQSR